MASSEGLREAVLARAREMRDSAALTIQNQLNRTCPVGQDAGGTLRDSLDMPDVETPDSVGVTVSYPVEYASYVRDGTPAHLIEGRPLLVFYWPAAGKTMYLRHVNHPGTTANPWFDDAIGSWGEALSAG